MKKRQKLFKGYTYTIVLLYVLYNKLYLVVYSMCRSASHRTIIQKLKVYSVTLHYTEHFNFLNYSAVLRQLYIYVKEQNFSIRFSHPDYFLKGHASLVYHSKWSRKNHQYIELPHASCTDRI